MTALTSDRDTVRRNGDEFEFEAASTVYAGSNFKPERGNEDRTGGT